MKATHHFALIGRAVLEKIFENGGRQLTRIKTPEDQAGSRIYVKGVHHVSL